MTGTIDVFITSEPNKNSKRKNELWSIYVIDKRTLNFCVSATKLIYESNDNKRNRSFTKGIVRTNYNMKINLVLQPLISYFLQYSHTVSSRDVESNTLNANTGNFMFQKKTSGRDWYDD